MELTKLQAAAAEYAAKEATFRDQITALRKANATAERKAADQAAELDGVQRRLQEAESKLGQVCTPCTTPPSTHTHTHSPRSPPECPLVVVVVVRPCSCSEHALQASDQSSEVAALQAELASEREKAEELATQKTSLVRKMESLQHDLKKHYVSSR